MDCATVETRAGSMITRHKGQVLLYDFNLDSIFQVNTRLGNHENSPDVLPASNRTNINDISVALM